MVVLVGAFAARSGADLPRVMTSSSLAPNLVTGGLKTLYNGSWTNQSKATLTNTSILITFPAGSALLSATPDVCSAGPASPGGALVITCARGIFFGGDTFTQQVLVQVPTVSVQANDVVTSLLKGDEKSSDTPDKSHADSFPAPDQAITIVPTTVDTAGSCLQSGDATLSTRGGLSSTNPLITTAGVTGATGLFCVPLTLNERARSSPTEACGTGATCTTDIAVTEGPTVSSPIQLTFTFLAGNRNLPWYKNAVLVHDCLGATELPTDSDACVNSRLKVDAKSVSLGVLWRGGPDPTWAG